LVLLGWRGKKKAASQALTHLNALIAVLALTVGPARAATFNVTGNFALAPLVFGTNMCGATVCTADLSGTIGINNGNVTTVNLTFSGTEPNPFYGQPQYQPVFPNLPFWNFTDSYIGPLSIGTSKPLDPTAWYLFLVGSTCTKCLSVTDLTLIFSAPNTGDLSNFTGPISILSATEHTNTQICVNTSNCGQVFYTFILPTPLPATLPLFATGLGVLGLLGWRRKRKAAPLKA
jgi:hypothetical protein